MNRRFFKSLTLWLLPLLVARAIVPVGFMFMQGNDGLQLMFCPAVVQEHGAPMAMGEHAGHHDPAMHAGHAAQNDQHPWNAGHDKTPCPFSLVASVALLDVPLVAADSIFVADETVEFTSGPVLNTGPLHSDRIRGPPQFS